MTQFERLQGDGERLPGSIQAESGSVTISKDGVAHGEAYEQRYALIRIAVAETITTDVTAVVTMRSRSSISIGVITDPA